MLVLRWVREHLYRSGVEQGLLAGSTDFERTKLPRFRDPHLLGTWQAFFTTRGTVFNDPVIWWTVLH